MAGAGRYPDDVTWIIALTAYDSDRRHCVCRTRRSTGTSPERDMSGRALRRSRCRPRATVTQDHSTVSACRGDQSVMETLCSACATRWVRWLTDGGISRWPPLSGDVHRMVCRYAILTVHAQRIVERRAASGRGRAGCLGLLTHRGLPGSRDSIDGNVLVVSRESHARPAVNGARKGGSLPSLREQSMSG